ncbi:rRNA pseudouridine synthase [Pseudoflavonifractor sp. 524-17]|uniref:pseudouridine synthase n=1 Tax=Pseudoflavonifractor sp. 524-17 TaxID=2304577 RepID=UPI001379B3B0|nr:pseudouridine synthase [Pseudoflavonifractor sp. 524-17]NCE64209.1 rRNA pseudouridine synthase [Pseudoflavonifractor sp. 524-17]
MEERLQKLLSAAGVASRRTAEGYITAGRVTVNGIPAQLGERADPTRDIICVDGRPLSAPEQKTYLMLNKPRGYVSTLSDERGRPTVSKLVERCGVRVWPVGRLDIDSEGLLLLTDDGELTQRLIHPSHEVEKEYHVWVRGNVQQGIPILKGPLSLDGRALHPAHVVRLDWQGEGGRLSITIHEGRNRQVRRMCALAGLTVTRLQRVREGELCLGDLRPGHWRRLTEQEVALLR